MSDLWSLLQIPPTQDPDAIKQAYAQQSRLHHPEEDPEGFQRLRAAYQEALKLARQPAAKAPPAPVSPEPQTPPISPLEWEAPPMWPEEETPPEDTEDTAVDFFFSPQTSDRDAFRTCGAFQTFSKGYVKENQKNWKFWMEYVTSPDFLTVSQEEGFWALLWETVQERRETCPPGPVLIKSLFIAYCLSEFRDEWGERCFHSKAAGVTVPSALSELLASAPPPKQFTGNDYAMEAAFLNYYHLRSIDEGIGWNDQGLHALQTVLNHFSSAYIKDNCPDRRMTETARHPLGLRLLNHFFATAHLTPTCYEITWNTYGLQQVLMGRSQILYGTLRQICLDHCPELAGGKQERFPEVTKAYNLLFNEEKHPNDVDALFDREDTQRALLNWSYVEHNVKNHWVGPYRSPHFLQRLRTFYEAHPDAPYASTILGKIQAVIAQKQQMEVDQEDALAPAGPEQISLTFRPFLRHWLNVAFPLCRTLYHYLEQNLPYSPEWSGRLFSAAPTYTHTVPLDGDMVELVLFPHHIEYSLQGRERCRPFLTLSQLQELNGDTVLWLLPLAVFRPDQQEEATRFLSDLLAQTALPQPHVLPVTQALVGGLTLPEEEESGAPLTLFQEAGDTLYGAQWWPDDQEMQLFQMQDGAMLYRPDLYENVTSEEEALSLGRELLSQLIAPPPLDCSSLTHLPEHVYFWPNRSCERELSGEEVTIPALNGLFEQFAGGELSRLELAFDPPVWDIKYEAFPGYPCRRSLVFLCKDGRVACLYFDDTTQFFYALRRENQNIGPEKTAFFNLTEDKPLPELCWFDSFFSLQCHLKDILSVSTLRDPKKAPPTGRYFWAESWGGVYRANLRVKYMLAKREVGQFHLERAYVPVEVPLGPEAFSGGDELSRRSSLELEWYTDTGEHQIRPIGPYDNALVKQTFAQFFQGQVVRMRLSWPVFPAPYRAHLAPDVLEAKLKRWEGKPLQSHIVLLRDGNAAMLLCLQDLLQQAEYFVADYWTYLDVEGKKYPKGTFLGKTVPTYLIHTDFVPLRNQLDLMLDHMDCLADVTHRFGTFADEKPVKARDYETIRREFVPEVSVDES